MGRHLQELTPEQQARIERLEQAAKDRAEADEAYRQAFVAARQSGATISSIARAVNISSEGVRVYLRRHGH